MPIQFRCHECGQLLSISRRKAGATVRCPACAAALEVPPLEEEAAEADDEIELTEAMEEEPPPPPPEFVRRREPVEPPGNEPSLRDALPSEREAESSASAAAPASSSGSADAPAAEVAIPSLRFEDEELEDPDDEEPDFQLRSRRLEVEEMDLTPMVDVTFLLLIFFMITASFSIQKSLEVPPPDSETKGQEQTLDELEELLDESIHVEIDAENNVVVEEEPVSDVDLLADTFRDVMQSDDKRELLLTVDAAALHDTVITVIDAAQDAGLQRIRLASGEAGEDE